MASDAYQLVVRKGPRTGQIFSLTEDAISIGRDPSSDIVINDAEISRHHAKLTLRGGGYWIQDLGSTNGSFVGGKRLGGEPQALEAGQVIMLGTNVTLVYQVTMDYDPMATVVAPADMLPVDLSDEEAAKPVYPADEEVEAPVEELLFDELEEEVDAEELVSDEFAFEEEIDELPEDEILTEDEIEEYVFEEVEEDEDEDELEADELDFDQLVDEVVDEASIEEEEEIELATVFETPGEQPELELEPIVEEEPVVEELSFDDLIFEEPDAEEPVIEMPVVDEPPVEEPASEEPAFEPLVAAAAGIADEEEEFATVLEPSEPFPSLVPSEPESEPEPEPFPSFEPEKLEPEPERRPTSFPAYEEPEPEPAFQEPVYQPVAEAEPKPAVVYDQPPVRAEKVDSGEPMFDFQPEKPAQVSPAPQPAPPAVDKPKKSGSNQKLIIAVVAVILICCCLTIAGVAAYITLYAA